MRLQGGHVFHVSREALWGCLFDPARLARVLPGCERFEQTGPTTYALELRIALPVLKGLYRGTIHMDDALVPERFVLRAEAEGPAGRVHGSGSFALAAVPARAGGAAGDTSWSSLSYTGEVHFSGVLKLLGAQVVSPAARAVIDRFFGRLEAEVLAGPPPFSAAPPARGADASSPSS
ncbi:MAG: hypothetical protein NVSMB65_09740 [Chloroflexota bacterium]